ncbi:MAG: class I SAM-dependent methyltransferase [Gemmataceae bacterium]
MNELQWAHRIDLGNGMVTPGAWQPSPLIRLAFDRIDFRGKKVLDVGCWDGLWSFEAERRGAREVFATDDVSQRPFGDLPTFARAAEVLGSQARYFPHAPVQTIESLGVDDFDIVLFCGVYYHLRDPLLALAKLRRVMRPGGLLLVEGEVLNERRRVAAEFLYRNVLHDDPSNWWLPTIPCLEEWVESSCFEVAWGYAREELPPIAPPGEEAYPNWLRRLRHGLRYVKRACLPPRTTRYLLAARAVARHDAKFRFPDRDLGPYHQAGQSGSMLDVRC